MPVCVFVVYDTNGCTKVALMSLRALSPAKLRAEHAAGLIERNDGRPRAPFFPAEEGMRGAREKEHLPCSPDEPR
jgi:hypothetical protein